MMTSHANGFVHSPNMKIAIPAVIRLTQYSKVPSSTVVFTRKNICDHYGGICCYCGEKFPLRDLTFDHVFPKSRGGKANWENIVLACIDCNRDKSDRTPKEAGLKMHYFPSKPKHQSPMRRMALSLPDRTKASWQKFISRAYWSSELME